MLAIVDYMLPNNENFPDTPKGPAKVDFLIGQLSDKDPATVRGAVKALGESGDRMAVEHLIFVFSREISRKTNSYALVYPLVDALACIPDVRSLDALARAESRMIDDGSPGCPLHMPVGTTAFIDTKDRQLRRIVPRKLHYKIFEGMQIISKKIGYRRKYVEDRLHAYQLEVLQDELDRTLPKMNLLLEEYSLLETRIDPGLINREPGEKAPCPGTPELPHGDIFIHDSMDHDRLKLEMEANILEYIQHNEKMSSLIRDGRKIKVHMRQVREQKRKSESGVPSHNSISVSDPAYHSIYDR